MPVIPSKRAKTSTITTCTYTGHFRIAPRAGAQPRSFITSMVINGLMLALFILIGAFAPKKILQQL
jgi:hypothetical protein